MRLAVLIISAIISAVCLIFGMGGKNLTKKTRACSITASFTSLLLFMVVELFIA